MTIRRTVLILAAFISISVAAQQRTVTFAYVTDKDAVTVYLAGTFNDWSRRDPMTSTDKRHWELKKNLAPGVYQYKFIINGDQWVTDPNAKTVDDGSGNLNSVLWLEPEGATQRFSRVGLSHNPKNRDVARLDDGRWRINLRARKGDFRNIELLLRGAPPTRMSTLGDDSLFTYFSATITSATPPRYAFELDPGLYLGARGIRHEAPDNEDWYSPIAVKSFVPTWVRDTVFYQIFPERFANGDKSNDPPRAAHWNGRPDMDAFFGGDLAGISQHLNYLQALGVTALVFNPLNKSPSNHKYDTDDYRLIDPHFGTNADFAALARNAHRRGMKVIMDGVYNHSSVNFFAFKDILKNQQTSKYLDWYHVTGFPVKFERNPKYWTWGGTEYMPKFNHENKDVREYLMSSAEMWLRLGDDGFRLDAANEVPADFWIEFRKRVKAVKPDAYICGEIWGDALPWLQGDQFDATMNYPFRFATLDFVKGVAKPSQFNERLLIQRLRYPIGAQYAMYNLLGSHDTKRLVNELDFDLRKVHLAKLIQFTYIGAPVIYYGDEVGMEGANELGSRLPMVWHLNYLQQQELDFTKRLVKLRLESEALRRGDFELALADDTARSLAYLRSTSRESALVVLNDSNLPHTITVAADGFKNGPIRDRVSAVEATIIDGKLTVNLPPYGGGVFVARR